MFENDENEKHDEAIGKVSSVREVKTFKPWHKPRKQWVRDNQWWQYFNILLTKRTNNYTNHSTVKYFGLPGAELLDIEYIAMKMLESDELCNKKLFIHGITSSLLDKQCADSRLSSLLDRENIDPLSKVDHSHFEALGQENSMLWNNVKSIAPYHLVNLDFCDKIFEERTISAVYRLLQYQFVSIIDRPWLFCLTTKVDTTATNTEVLARLDRCLQSIEDDDLSIFNLQVHFEPVFDAVRAKKSIMEYTDDIENFTDIFLVGFVIWIVLTCIEQQVDFKLKSSSKYRVADTSTDFLPDMYSLVFEFKNKFIPQGDPTGIATQVSSQQTESDEGIDPREKIINKLSKTIDLDIHLNDNNEILEKYINEAKQLLQQCGINVTDYEKEMCQNFVMTA